jgi:hypothetical protein
VSNRILSVATFVATKVCRHSCLNLREKHCICHQKTIPKNCLSPNLNLLPPHVANGDRVGHLCFKSYNWDQPNKIHFLTKLGLGGWHPAGLGEGIIDKLVKVRLGKS